MIDANRIYELLSERKTFWKQNDCLDRCHIFEEKYVSPMLEAIGDSEEEIKSFLINCSKEDLVYMSEFFENIYERFNNEDMWQFLEKMEHRIR